MLHEVNQMLMAHSYNKINGSWSCENDGVLNKLLKDELGHRGYIMSDWNGRYFSVVANVFTHILGCFHLHIFSPTHHDRQREQRSGHDHAWLRLHERWKNQRFLGPAAAECNQQSTGAAISPR
jgi:hypothetical protein